eukprot:g19029.t1
MEMSPEQAAELAQRLYKSVFSWGYQKGEEPAMPSAAHGTEQIAKGVVLAPVTGVVAGLGIGVAGVFAGFGHTVSGVIEGGAHLLHGNISEGIKAPLRGVGRGALAVGAGVLGAFGAGGVGLYAGFQNVVEGTKEISRANAQAREVGIPVNLLYGEAVKELRLTERVQQQGYLTLEKGEEVLLCYDNRTSFDKKAPGKDGVPPQEKSEEEKQEEYGDINNFQELFRKQAEEKKELMTHALLANCILLTEHRVISIRHGKLRESILREDIRAVRQYAGGKASQTLGSQWRRIAVTLNDGSEAQIQVMGQPVTSYLARLLQKDLAHYDSSVPLFEGKQDKLSQVERDLQIHRVLTLCEGEQLLLHQGYRNTEGWLVTSQRFIRIKNHEIEEDIPRQAIARASLGASMVILELTNGSERKYRVSSKEMSKELSDKLNSDGPDPPILQVSRAKGPRHPEGISTSIYVFSKSSQEPAKPESPKAENKQQTGEASPAAETLSSADFAAPESAARDAISPMNQDGPLDKPTSEEVEGLD